MNRYFEKVSVKLSHGWRRLPLFMDEYRQELTVNSKWLFMFSLSWVSVGFQGDAGGSIPLGVVATATRTVNQTPSNN